MLFNSIHFLIFFPVVTFSYFIIPYRFRWILLLAASYYFYMVWRPIYALLIVGSTLVDYLVAIQMSKTSHQAFRRLYLFISLFVNLGMLFVFKYYGLFIDSINAFSSNSYDVIYLVLPMGISFYTFQTLSYTIDVYRKDRDPETHLGYFALYVTFFPQLVAGPIERSDRLIPQLRINQKFNYTRLVEGVRRMVWGFFKKLVIADNLAVAVNHVYGNAEESSGLTILVATVFFAYQIYCDFSGYSDIAIGSAKVLGIDLMENFNRPYGATSIKEFWSRWHISLSTWFRDYVYIPLGGSRVSEVRTYVNIMIVFLLSGLWHGASWLFVLWGTIHGLYQLYERSTYHLRNRLWKVVGLDGTRFQSFVKWSMTMTVVLFSWIIFRANSYEIAFIIFDKITRINSISIPSIIIAITSTNIDRLRFIVVLVSIIIVELNDFVSVKSDFSSNLKRLSSVFESYEFSFTLILLIIAFGAFGLQEFIYFQF
jgi:alginate O-acetyltransferase complex protein AlgI